MSTLAPTLLALPCPATYISKSITVLSAVELSMAALSTLPSLARELSSVDNSVSADGFASQSMRFAIKIHFRIGFFKCVYILSEYDINSVSPTATILSPRPCFGPACMRRHGIARSYGGPADGTDQAHKRAGNRVI